MAKAAKDTQETVYDRIEKLEDEIATLRNEIDVIKSALRNKLARHEVKMIKKGNDVTSIIDNSFYCISFEPVDKSLLR